ncbi:MAG: molybdopterin dinucleotide binding domain-containing protein, partial [Candidatus Bathyarchaeia archaeon]
MEFILITGRTINQGKFKEHAKITEKYMASVAVCEMHAEDMVKIGVRDGDNVKVTTVVGSVVVKAKRSKRIKTPGLVFIPFGPWVNSILPSET